MAASNRNKLDEYHLKILRELLTHPTNKYCFDCHQRGPTYVNVTIGSFVCTTCSGMLRGLTPPHRVKSITMATFTPEEIEIMKSRGNQYCKSIWLGLYDSEVPTSDEQQIKDFMIAKYEKKRYYVDPSLSTNHCAINFANGSRTPSSLSSASSSSHNSPSSQNLSDSSSKIQNTFRTQLSKTSSVTSNCSNQLFASNFDSPGLSTSSSSSIDLFCQPVVDASSSPDTSFANFENNPAFGGLNATSASTAVTSTSDFLNNSNTYTSYGLTWGYPRGSYQRSSLKSLPLAFSRWSIATENTSNFVKNKNDSNVPPEDKYAALKDLDSQMKSQLIEKQQEELKQKLGTNSNGVSWTSLFESNHGVSSEPSTPYNPFADQMNTWSTSSNGSVNPFGNSIKDAWKTSFTNTPTLTPNGWKADEVNPFKIQMGLWTQSNGPHQSSNPFL